MNIIKIRVDNLLKNKKKKIKIMNDLQKKWKDEAFDGIDKISNYIDVIKKLKDEALKSQNYEEASLVRDLEMELLSSISKLVSLNINMKHQINDK